MSTDCVFSTNVSSAMKMTLDEETQKLSVKRASFIQSWRVDGLVSGLRITRRYTGYTQEEAIEAWNKEFKNESSCIL